MVKKFEDMFIRFDMIHERDRQTNGQTDGRFDMIHERDRQTNGQTDGHRVTA